MDETEELIGQMGLLLTQVRYARRALEDIERTTATYGGIAVLEGMMSGDRFGAPPLLNGALKVYVVNIRDLVAGSSLGSVIEGFFGGIGRFVGGLVGGVAGGVVGGAVVLPVSLPIAISRMADITRNVDRIVSQLRAAGVLAPAPPSPAAATAAASAAVATGAAAAGAAANGSGSGAAEPGFLDSLPSITNALAGLTALFRAAGGGPGDTSGPTATQSAALEGLQRVLQPVYAILDSISRIVDGLILLVPILTGAFASFLDKLDVLKLHIVEFLQFFVRNAFLLAGVALAVFKDIGSTAASLAAEMLGIIGQAVDTILTAVFDAIGTLLRTALGAFQFIAGGVQRTVDALLNWLVGTVHAVLTTLGDTAIFRVVYHAVDILPDVLPALVELIHGRALTGAAMTGVQAARRKTLPPASSPPAGTPTIPTFPDLAATLAPTTAFNNLLSDVDSLRDLGRNASTAIGASQRALRRIGRSIDNVDFGGRLQGRFATLRGQADTLAGTFGGARTAAQASRDPRLREVAEAYEQWMDDGGLTTLLDRVTAHFSRTPVRASGSIPAQIVTDTAFERARATVEIEEVVVELAPPSVVAAEGAAAVDPSALLDDVLDAWYDRVRRGARPGPDTLSLA